MIPHWSRMGWIGLVLAIVCGLTAAPVAGSVQQGQGTDSEAIDLGQNYERDMGPNNSKDVYTFTAEAGDLLRLSTMGPPDKPTVRLRGPNGQELIQEDLYPDQLSYGVVAPADGQYTLVFTSPLEHKHRYRFVIRSHNPDSIGGPSNPATFTPGDPQTAAVQSGDTDTWEIDVPADGRLKVSIGNEQLIGASIGAKIINKRTGETVAVKETNCTPGTGLCEIGDIAADVPAGTYAVSLYDTGAVPGFVEYTLRASVPEAPETKRIRISSDERVRYQFSVSGMVTRVNTDSSETVQNGEVTGIVNGGSDVFEYTGEILDYEDDGSPTVQIDGQEVSPYSLGDKNDDEWRRMRITSNGRADYAFEIDGEVRPVDTNLEDTITGGKHARGAVHGGADVYKVRGPLVHMEADGNVEATIGGDSIEGRIRQQSSMPDRHGLRITGDGDKDTWVVYDITVTGEIQMADEADGDEESASGSSASGGIVDDEDTFVYTGNIVSIDARGDGDATFEVDNKELGVSITDTSTPPTATPTPDSSTGGSGDTDRTTPAADSGGDTGDSSGDGETNAGGGETPTQTAVTEGGDGDGGAGPSMPGTTTTAADSTPDSEQTTGKSIISTPTESSGDGTGDENGLSTGVGDGFGAIAALIAIVASLLLARRRK